MRRRASVYFLMCLLILLLRPWPSELVFGGSATRVVEALSFLAVATIVFLFVLERQLRLPASTPLLICVLTLSVVVWPSLIYNINSIVLSDLIEAIRPLYFLVLSLVGYYGARILGVSRSWDIFAKTVVVVALCQIPLAFLQLNFPTLVAPLELVYSAHKVEIEWMRATGIFGNPNHLALFLVIGQLAVLTSLSRPSRWWLWIALFAGVLLSGSVALVIISPVMAVVFTMFRSLKHRGVTAFVWRLCFSFVVLLVVAGAFVYTPLDRWPRLERAQQEIKNVNSTGGIRNVGQRTAIWQDRLKLIEDRESSAWFFGMGPMKGRGLDYVDNEILFITLRHGVVGLISMFLFVLLLYRVFWAGNGVWALFGLLVVVLYASLVSVYEVFSLWRYMPYYALPLGAVVASNNSRL